MSFGGKRASSREKGHAPGDGEHSGAVGSAKGLPRRCVGKFWCVGEVHGAVCIVEAAGAQALVVCLCHLAKSFSHYTSRGGVVASTSGIAVVARQ